MDARRARFLTRPLLVAGLLLALLGGSGAALALDIQDEILVQVAGIRGLQPKASVPFAFVDANTLRSSLIESFENDTSVHELETSRKLLVLLGLLSPDADLHSMLINLYAENIAGYYNHHDKKMYVVSGTPNFGPEEKITLAHEFTHALQDQYFDLEKLEAGTEENGDYSLAVQALFEGDATLTMVIYARRFLSLEELFQLQTSAAAGTLEQAPLVVRDEIVFPYDEGALFVFRLWQATRRSTARFRIHPARPSRSSIRRSTWPTSCRSRSRYRIWSQPSGRAGACCGPTYWASWISVSC